MGHLAHERERKMGVWVDTAGHNIFAPGVDDYSL